MDSSMEQRVKVFPYVVQEERPLSDLGAFADHRRLQTFYRKGCTCVSCGLEGTRLILGRNVKDGSKHWDVYSDDLTPLTVDHIQPKSLGGSDTLGNYQPMCSPCNTRKGNGLRNNPPRVNHPKPKELVRYKGGMNVVGMELWRVYVVKNKNKKPKFLGIVDSLGINPHCQKPAIIVVGGKVSFHNISRSLYVKEVRAGSERKPPPGTTPVQNATITG